MSETTEIIAVSSTAALGLGTLAASAFGAWSRRRWESREERVIEIRDLLDNAGTAISTALRGVDTSWDAGNAEVPPIGLVDLGATLDHLWVLEDRLAVRLGPDDPITGAFEKAHQNLRSASVVPNTPGAAGHESELREFNQYRKAAFEAQKEYFRATKALIAVSRRR